MSTVTEAVLQISEVTHTGDYRLRLAFSDGKTVTVDFEPFLSQSQHPEIRKYLDLALFKSYRLDAGDLMWGDFDLCFPVADLYDGRI